MWWGGFSERIFMLPRRVIKVLIPMWWGGFSEFKGFEAVFEILSLNPHVVGRFFREPVSEEPTTSKES